MSKYKFALIGCLLVPVFMRININGTGLESDFKRYIIPFFVGGSAGFFIGLMKDRWLKLNSELDLLVKQRTAELKKTLDEVKTLRGILPICSFCKKVRDDKGYWEQVDVYINKHTEVDISHSICQDCLKKHYPEEYESIYPHKG